jgi:hypothetical protein
MPDSLPSRQAASLEASGEIESRRSEAAIDPAGTVMGRHVGDRLRRA